MSQHSERSTDGWYSRTGLTYDLQRLFQLDCVGVRTKTWYVMIWSVTRRPPTRRARLLRSSVARRRDTQQASTLHWYKVTQSFLRHSEKTPTQRYVLSSLKGESLIPCAYTMLWIPTIISLDQRVRGQHKKSLVADPASIHFNHYYYFFCFFFFFKVLAKTTNKNINIKTLTTTTFTSETVTKRDQNIDCHQRRSHSPLPIMPLFCPVPF